ncbi:type IV toxin-antitoxin system AbiEi family antitoxin domain-containing protein [Kribbella sp. NPDC051620]|uniref:type IV toxin-antitoxin system AbiEi family antitoxin domain-containing protein n=1 Tax=Kribbella sp. NPDC051620 TaxID=3364120 RepID=UPI00378E9D46
MNLKLATVAARRGGWFDRADVLAAGYSDDDIHLRIKDGRWVRLFRGVYAEAGGDYDLLAPWDQRIWRHVRTAKAAYHQADGRAVLSHQSALLVHGVQIGDLDLSRVHLTNLARLGRSTKWMGQHAPRPPVLDPVEVEGVWLTPAPRSVVEAIRGTSYPVAVSVVDEALRRKLATSAQLSEALRLFGGRTGIGTATRAVPFGDGRSESAGESRLRVLMADLGLPKPRLQAEIRDLSGRLVGRVDFLFEEWAVIVEFDGALKYAGKGSAPLVLEKAREDALRDLGYEVVRATWSDLSAPAAFTVRVAQARDRSRRRSNSVSSAAGNLQGVSRRTRR